jgi:hypothetical protein
MPLVCCGPKVACSSLLLSVVTPLNMGICLKNSFSILISLFPILAMAATPIESGANIYDKWKGETALLEEMARKVRANRYKCDSISAALPEPFFRGCKLRCNNFAYEYKIEDKGGNWVVTVE